MKGQDGMRTAISAFLIRGMGSWVHVPFIATGAFAPVPAPVPASMTLPALSAPVSFALVPFAGTITPVGPPSRPAPFFTGIVLGWFTEHFR